MNRVALKGFTCSSMVRNLSQKILHNSQVSDLVWGMSKENKGSLSSGNRYFGTQAKRLYATPDCMVRITVTYYGFIQMGPHGWRSRVGRNANNSIAVFSRDNAYQPQIFGNSTSKVVTLVFGAFPAEGQLHRSRPQQEIPYISGLQIFLLTAVR